MRKRTTVVRRFLLISLSLAALLIGFSASARRKTFDQAADACYDKAQRAYDACMNRSNNPPVDFCTQVKEHAYNSCMTRAGYIVGGGQGTGGQPPTTVKGGSGSPTPTPGKKPVTTSSVAPVLGTSSPTPTPVGRHGGPNQSPRPRHSN